MLRADVLMAVAAAAPEPFQFYFPSLTEHDRLTFDPVKYFLSTPRTFLLPVAALVFGGIRDGAVERANQLMKDAYRGVMPPRNPIDVRRLEGSDRWLIVDGNSTCMNAVLSGWPDVPCIDVGSCEG